MGAEISQKFDKQHTSHIVTDLKNLNTVLKSLKKMCPHIYVVNTSWVQESLDYSQKMNEEYYVVSE